MLVSRISAHTISNEEFDPVTMQLELDSHADSPIMGGHAKVLEYTGRTVNVQGFSDNLGKPIKVDIVNVALVYDCSYSGESHILHLRNALYMNLIEVSLIPPFMMRLAGLYVNKCPKFLLENPSITDHIVYSKEHDVRLPLKLEGIISYLPCRTPANDELDSLPTVIDLTPTTVYGIPMMRNIMNRNHRWLITKGSLNYQKKDNLLSQS